MHQRPNTIETVDDDEEKLCEVKKHPFGIISVYIMAVFGMILIVGMAFALLPGLMEDQDAALLIASVFSGVSVIATFAVISLSSYVYKQNKLVVTDRNITQTLQYGLFSKKVSQLNIVNVEDVTSVQNGFLATMIGFGTLNIETAGEQSNFNFSYCPNSGHCAKIILDARERMLGQMKIAGTDAMHKPKSEVNIALKAKRTVHKKVKSVSSKPKKRTLSMKNIGAEVVEQAFDNQSPKK